MRGHMEQIDANSSILGPWLALLWRRGLDWTLDRNTHSMQGSVGPKQYEAHHLIWLFRFLNLSSDTGKSDARLHPSLCHNLDQ